MRKETTSLLQVIVISLLYTCIIIGLFTGALYLYNGLILINALSVTGAVLGIGYLFNLHTIQQFNKFVATQQADVMKKEQDLFFQIDCCECGRSNAIKMNLNQDMVFECEECKVLNKVFYTFKTGRPTEIPKNTNVVEFIQDFVKE